jgi:hypothetical protein
MKLKKKGMCVLVWMWMLEKEDSLRGRHLYKCLKTIIIFKNQIEY